LTRAPLAFYYAVTGWRREPMRVIQWEKLEFVEM